MKVHIPANLLRRFVLSVLAVAIFATWVPSAPAQTADASKSEMQQMQERIDQLEQEMRELKQHLATVEQQPKIVAVSTPAQPASAMVGQENQTAPEGSVEKSASASTLKIYGFAMLDSGYDFKTNNPDWFDVMRPTKLPAFDGEFAPDGKVYFGVRQTRFGVKSSTATPIGNLKTIFEFELFGTGVDAGQTTFRLRHAWGELGQFGAGQTWSPFMDPDVFPNSLEYWGPNGMVFFRNVQFRWTPIRRGDSHLIIAAERPGASADQGIYADRIAELGINIRSQFNMPDFSVQGHLARSWGYVQVAAMFRKISWVDLTATPALDLGDTVFGWGINTSSNVKLGKKSTAKLQVVYGQGIENYMNDAPIDIGVKNNFSNPQRPILGVPLPVLGVVSFVDHTWSEKFSTSVGYSFENIWNTDAELPEDFHQGHYALANLLYNPAKDVMMGGEFQFGRRLNFDDGFNVNDYRMQFGFKYSWAKEFGLPHPY